MERVILHNDCNSFYASVECLHHPEIRNKPVTVGGDVEQRHDIISAKNQIAKQYSIKTGEALWQARQKCPDLVIVPPDYHKYERFSKMATPRDLVNDENVKIILCVLSDSIARRLREQGFKGRTVTIYVRDNELSRLTRQRTLGAYTNITSEILKSGMELFRRHYHWQNPIRSVGISISDLVGDTTPTQTDLFSNEAVRELKERLDATTDWLKKRFGTSAVLPALLLKDTQLSGFDPQKNHTIHPVGYF